MIRTGSKTDEAGSIVLKFTGQISGTPSKKKVTIGNTRQNKSLDEGFESTLNDIVIEELS